MKIWSDYYKVLDVIDSCVTLEQLRGALRMLELWKNKHLDEKVYSTTLQNHVYKKFKELKNS